jgi:serine protease AprX
MNTRSPTFETLNYRLVIILVLIVLLSIPVAPAPAPAGPSVGVIVQGMPPGGDLAALVQRYDGQVTRDLSLINAVAATLPAGRLAALQREPAVVRVWPDSAVRSSDTADPGIIFAPTSGGEYKPAGFDLRRVATLDGDKENMDEIPLGDVNPGVFQTYTFSPAIDPANMPGSVHLRFVFKEKSLGQAQLRVYQASTRDWHTFEMDTLSTNDSFIDATFDLSGALATPEDLAKVVVRFLVSRNDGGEKAEVDYVGLQLGAFADGSPTVNYAPVAGSEYKPAGFDLKKVRAYDGDKDDLDEIPLNAIDANQGQVYTFNPVIDPADMPGLVDLRFIFKEKSLGQAQLQVYQASTQTWHTFEVDTLSTNDRYIDATFDLTDALETPEDFAQVAVRFIASRNDGGEKAEVDLISLRLAALVGDTPSFDVAQSFEAANAASVWDVGYTGMGVGIAVLDSGVKKYKELEKDTRGNKNGFVNGWSALTNKNDGKKDKNGHGTLVASIVSNQKRNTYGKFFGVAPDSVIIPIQVLDEEGKGLYSQVIAGIQWAIEHRDEYNIRVMNLSLSAPVRSHYWDDPLNQAVMQAWEAGIVVVVAAGNSGPDPMSVGVPGNNPYAITVGALTDAYTPTDWSDDYVPSFSASGPTYEGFIKPDLVAPGGHVAGVMSEKCKLAKEHPNHKIDKDYFQLSGTSMSAAQVSGVVALMLSRSPNLTPDQVKYRLLASARPAVHPDGQLAFSIWRQGAGRVDAYGAVFGDYEGSANYGLDIAADLEGSQHFGGYTRWNPETEEFYLAGPDGSATDGFFTWGGGFAWSEGYAWGGGFAWSEIFSGGFAWSEILSGGFAWSENFAWSGGFAWSETYTWGGGFAWSEVYTWGGGFAWSETDDGDEPTVSLVTWVPPE